MPTLPDSVLCARDLCAGYGGKPVLDGVSIDVGAGEVVTVIGHNGAGKSTLLKTLFGLVPLRSGVVVVAAEPLVRLAPPLLLARGVVYVPQGGQVFPDLTVREHLDLSQLVRPVRGDPNHEQVLAHFSLLRPLLNRRAGQLSGGQRQMLALAVGFAARPKVLLLDEPSLGLTVDAFRRLLDHIKELVLDTGLCCIVVEQKVREILRVADRVYVLRGGRVSFSGPASALASDADLTATFL